MSTNQNNLGQWSAHISIEGKAPHIIVNGSFPTKGHKPRYHLVKNDPQGIVKDELLLTLIFGILVDPDGDVFFNANYSEIINSSEVYKTVHVVDTNNRTIANIDIESDKEIFAFSNNNIEKTLYREHITIKGIEIIENKLKIRYFSGGCTTKESFEINVIKGFTGLPPYLVEIFRIEPDVCESYIPDGIVVEYELSELGLKSSDSFFITNTIG